MKNKIEMMSEYKELYDPKDSPSESLHKFKEFAKKHFKPADENKLRQRCLNAGFVTTFADIEESQEVADCRRGFLRCTHSPFSHLKKINEISI